MKSPHPASDYREDLAAIRGILERSSRFFSLSGFSGVLAGLFALAGAAVAYGWLGYGSPRFEESLELLPVADRERTLLFLFLDACLVLLLALASSYYFTRRKARKAGLPLWSQATGRVLASLAIPLLTGGGLCLILFMQGETRLLAGLTLVFYGLALVHASRYLVVEIRYLGLSEILLGWLACTWPAHGLLLWAIGFGVLHIVYGFAMLYRYERSDKKTGQSV